MMIEPNKIGAFSNFHKLLCLQSEKDNYEETFMQEIIWGLFGGVIFWGYFKKWKQINSLIYK